MPLWPGSSRREDNAAKYENQADKGRAKRFVEQKGRHAVEQRGRSAKSQVRHQRNNRREY